MQSGGSGIVDVIGCCGFVLILGLTFYTSFISLRFHWQEAPEALHRWAKENGHLLRTASASWFFRGPFFWTSSGWQAVFRVTVETPKGQTKRGWVRIGSYCWRNPDQIEVVWDPVRPERATPPPSPSQGHPPMWDPDLDSRGS